MVNSGLRLPALTLGLAFFAVRVAAQAPATPAPAARPTAAPQTAMDESYRIVRKDGTVVSARAMFRIEGDRVVFQTPEGAPGELPLAEVDLEATLRRNQAPAPTPSQSPPANPQPPLARIPAPDESAPGAQTQEVLFYGEGGGGLMQAAGDRTNRGGVFSGSFGRYTRTRFFRIDARLDAFQTDVRFRSQHSFLGSGRYYLFTDNNFKEDRLESLDIRASLGKGIGVVWSAQDRGLPDYIRQRTFESEVGLYFQVEDYLHVSGQQAILKLGSNLDFFLKRVYAETRVNAFAALNDPSASRVEFDHALSWPLTRAGDWRFKALFGGEWLLGNRPPGGRALVWRAQVQLVWQFRRQKKVLVKALEVLDTD